MSANKTTDAKGTGLTGRDHGLCASNVTFDPLYVLDLSFTVSVLAGHSTVRVGFSVAHELSCTVCFLVF